jgi:hypothetical protein
MLLNTAHESEWMVEPKWTIYHKRDSKVGEEWWPIISQTTTVSCILWDKNCRYQLEIAATTSSVKSIDHTNRR